MSYSYQSPSTSQPARPGRRKAWLAMSAASVAVAVVSFFVFGVFGGFMLLVALNGFSEKQAAPVFVIYFVVALGLTTLVAAFFNWLIIRYGFRAAGISGWAAFVPAAASSLGLLLVGPTLAVVFMKIVF
ncbi:MAG TPA: hypothetical protein VN228_13535 [Pyrinomonadaceae bacterium]|nr:hypothetical protein [Pyrinomonadaceae bacterium]